MVTSREIRRISECCDGIRTIIQREGFVVWQNAERNHLEEIIVELESIRKRLKKFTGRYGPKMT